MIALELFKRVFPYIIALCVVAGCLFGAYHHGVSVTSDKYELKISKMRSDAQQAALAHDAEVLNEQTAHAQDVADISTQYQKVILNEKAIHEDTVSQLQLGTIRLRKQFAAIKLAKRNIVSSVAASASSSHDAYGPGLQQQDVDFLLSEAGRADQVVDQLAACQKIIDNDRSYRNK